MKRKMAHIHNYIPEHLLPHDALGKIKPKRFNVVKRLRYKALHAPELNVTYVNLGIRAIAKFVDFIVLFSIYVIIETLLFDFNFASRDYNFFRIIIGFTIWILYNGLLESSILQATIGKMVFNIKVVDLYGKRLQVFIACLRCINTLFSILPAGLGIWYITTDPKKQSWHDLMTGTYVIKA